MKLIGDNKAFLLQKVCTIDRTQIMALTLATIPGITIKKPITERIQDTTLDIIRRRIMVPAIQTTTTMQTSMEGKGVDENFV